MLENMDTPIQETEDLSAIFEGVEETPTETIENVEEVVEAEPEVEQVQEEKPFDWSSLEFKNLKEVRKLGELSPSEVIERLQKGSDYDRIRTGHDQYKEVKEVAKLLGYEPATLLEVLRAQHFANTAENNGTNEDFERKSYELTLKEQQLQEIEQQKQEQNKINDSVNEFMKAYPGVNTATLPKEVLEAVVNGDNLTQAYTRHQVKLQADENAALKKQLDNLKRAPVGSTTSSGTDTLSLDDEIGNIFEML